MSSQTCAWCGKHRSEAISMYGYTDEKHDIGRANEHFPDNKDLLPITLCCKCLLSHVEKYYPGSPNHKDCLARLEYAGEIQPNPVQPKLI